MRAGENMDKDDKRRLKSVKTGLYMITAICGLVDAVCFLALGGVFAEMMTGNLLLMAFSIGMPGHGDSARYMPAILAFCLGALLGGRLLRGPAKWQERRIGFAVEWLVILAATAVAWRGDPDAHNLAGQAVVTLLAFAMGIQNAMVRVHGVSRSRDERDDRDFHRHHCRFRKLPAATTGTGGAG